MPSFLLNTPSSGYISPILMGSPDGSDGKESACNAKNPGSIPGWGRVPWRREWQPTPVFFPGEFHGLKGLIMFFGRTDAKAETPILWPPHVKS